MQRLANTLSGQVLTMAGVGKVSRCTRGMFQLMHQYCTYSHQRRCTTCSDWPAPCQARPPPWPEWGKCPDLQDECYSQGVTFILALIREGVPHVAFGQHLFRPCPYHGRSGESVQIYKRDVKVKALVLYSLSSEKVYHMQRLASTLSGHAPTMAGVGKVSRSLLKLKLVMEEAVRGSLSHMTRYWNYTQFFLMLFFSSFPMCSTL